MQSFFVEQKQARRFVSIQMVWRKHNEMLGVVLRLVRRTKNVKSLPIAASLSTAVKLQLKVLADPPRQQPASSPEH